MAPPGPVARLLDALRALAAAVAAAPWPFEGEPITTEDLEARTSSPPWRRDGDPA